MSKKDHAPGPVPPGNQSHAGPAGGPAGDGEHPKDAHTTTGDSEADPQRRLGGYTGKGEAPVVQPDRSHGRDANS